MGRRRFLSSTSLAVNSFDRWNLCRSDFDRCQLYRIARAGLVHILSAAVFTCGIVVFAAADPGRPHIVLVMAGNRGTAGFLNVAAG